MCGKKSCRGGLGAKELTGPTEVCTGHCSGTGEKLNPRGFSGGAWPLGLLAAGIAGHTQTLPVHRLLPLQRAQRPLSAPALGRKGQGAAFVFKLHPPQQHKRPSISLRGSMEQRESRATIAPTLAPGATICWAVSLQVTHLAPQPQTQGERGQEKGASTACFPSAQPRNFFCAEQGLAHSSTEQLPHRCAEPATAPAGTGAVLAQALCPSTGSSRDREGVTRISRAGPCSAESGRPRCMCRATLGTITVTDTSSTTLMLGTTEVGAPGDPKPAYS